MEIPASTSTCVLPSEQQAIAAGTAGKYAYSHQTTEIIFSESSFVREINDLDIRAKGVELADKVP